MNDISLNEMMDNVKLLYSKYGKQVLNTDRKLVMMYWKDFNSVQMDKDNISTQDFLNLAEDYISIINAKMMIQAIYESER